MEVLFQTLQKMIVGTKSTTNKTVCLISLGCPKNTVDSEIILGYLKESGFQITTQKEKAEIIIINTCAFIKEATQESIQEIFEAAQFKKKGRCQLLIVAGCLTQRYREKLLKELPEVNIFIGTGEFPKIVQIIDEHQRNNPNKPLYINKPEFLINHDTPRLLSTPFYTAYLKIAEGCSNNCSYCLIPSLRGKYRSRSIDSITLEAKKLAQLGVKEINLIAQDTTRFGYDLGDGTNIITLLQSLVKIQEIEWIRLLYCHPDSISMDLLSFLASEEKICKYLDIPIQHVCSSILRKMHRKGNKDSLRKFFSTIREIIPEITLRTTVMVGFPGETEREFTELLKFINEMNFDHLGVFKYSKEEGTLASKMDKQVPQKVKEKRYNLLMETQSLISFKKNQKRIGSNVKVLVESECTKNNYYPYKGRTPYQAPEIDGIVYLTKTKAKIGDIIEARIIGALEYDLIAELI